MGLRVWVVEEQTHAHVPVGFPFEPINKPMGIEIKPNAYPNRAKTHQVSGSAYPLPSLCERVSRWPDSGGWRDVIMRRNAKTPLYISSTMLGRDGPHKLVTSSTY
jgi:hypothetical protein